MPSAELQPGLVFSRTITVDERLLATSLASLFAGFAGMPPVFPTAFIVALVEWTCIDGLQSYLLDHEHTVGTLIDVNHIAATPVGMRVTAEVRLLAVVGRKLRFVVRCHDDREVVGKGSHERTLIRSASFMRRIETKRALADGALSSSAPTGRAVQFAGAPTARSTQRNEPFLKHKSRPPRSALHAIVRSSAIADRG
jgi:fluoroacetyl-CoA thioesterase